MPGKSTKKTTVIRQQAKPLLAGKKEMPIAIPKWAVPALLVFTALLYTKALQNGFTGFDDDFYVTRNPLLHNFSLHGVRVIFTSFYYSNYHPLTIFIYLLEYKLFALNPFPYHLLNVMLHLLNIWLVFKLTMQLSKNKLTALCVAVLFAIHPMHIESVAWISELKDVLYSFFFLSSLLFYHRYTESGFRATPYIIALFLFLLSLLSKSAAVTLPVLLIVIDIYKGRSFDKRFFIDKVPFLLLSMLFGILNMISFKEAGTLTSSIGSYGFINKIFLCTYALQSYIVKAVFPYGLSAMHHYPPLYSGWLPWQYYPSLIFVLLVGWLALRRSSLRKEIIFGLAFFLVAISVMLQIISFSSHLYAERYTYIAYVGLFYIAGQWIAKTGIVKWRTPVIWLCLALAVVYSAQSWARMGAWKDSMTLFNDMVEKEPDVYFGYYMRGNAEKSDGDLQGAMQDYTTAIRLNPDFEDIYYNRGILYDMAGNYQSAISDYSNSIRLNPKPDAYNNRGWARFQSGDTTAAIRDISEAIRLKPDYAEAYNNRGWIYYRAGNVSRALPDFDKAISINPNYDKPLYNRASLKESTGDLAGAIEDFTAILRIHPDDNIAWYYRGKTRLMLKDTAAACADFNKAKELGNEAAAEMVRKYCH